jgi:hypothetical protein
MENGPAGSITLDLERHGVTSMDRLYGVLGLPTQFPGIISCEPFGKRFGRLAQHSLRMQVWVVGKFEPENASARSALLQINHFVDRHQFSPAH